MSTTDSLLPLNTRHLLAFARRYAQERATGVAAIIAREVVQMWPRLPRWEQEQHQKELREHRATWDQADHAAWQQVLDLPLRADDETPMPAAVQELAASKELKAWPPHIKSTRKLLAQAGALTPAVEDAMTLAAACYQETPQQSQIAKYKRERDQTQDELERVSQKLLDERKGREDIEKLNKDLVSLRSQVAQQKHQLTAKADERANDKISLYMQHNALLESSLANIAAALMQPLAHHETKIYSARKAVALALEQSTNRKKRILARKLTELNGAAPPDEAVAAAETADCSL